MTVSAQTQTSPLPEKKAFEAALDVSYLTYNEPNVKTQGMMYGLAGSYPTGFVWQEPENNSVEIGIRLAVKF